MPRSVHDAEVRGLEAQVLYRRGPAAPRVASVAAFQVAQLRVKLEHQTQESAQLYRALEAARAHRAKQKMMAAGNAR